MVFKELARILSNHQPASVTSVTSDSRAVGPSTAFVAIRGGKQDGHEFISRAIQAGAPWVIGEEPVEKYSTEIKNGSYLQVTDSRLALAFLAAHLAGHPSHSMTVVGVTGTSGKTTTTFLIESILKAAGHKVGVIGTVNFRFDRKIYPSTHTTPGSVELQGLLAEMRRDGCTAVVMEVSSHALKQHRVAFTAFDAMVFTNLTREHLDFHPDMEDYYRSKAMLFTDSARYSIESGKRPFMAINQDDEWGRKLIQELNEHPNPGRSFKSFGLDPRSGVSGGGLKVDLAGIHGKAGGVEVDSDLTGRFNAENILSAISIGLGLHLSPNKISEGLAALKTVPGRLERVSNTRGIHVLVDYAHKSDALEKVLKTLREVRSGHRLITVFGCGGDRDRLKRPVMGKLAVEFSDQVFLTSDNPRTENPDTIIQEVLNGAKTLGSRADLVLNVEPDRRKAIFLAIACAKPGDLVLIAGKGHEDYQMIADPSDPSGTRKIHFDDREVASEALSSLEGRVK